MSDRCLPDVQAPLATAREQDVGREQRSRTQPSLVLGRSAEMGEATPTLVLNSSNNAQVSGRRQQFDDVDVEGYGQPLDIV